MHRFGYVRESTFNCLGYPEDRDRFGNYHPLLDTLISQPHRQRFLIPTNDHLKEQFLDFIAKSKEGTTRINEQELIDRNIILRGNAEAEAKLHVLAGRKSDSCCSQFAENPPTLEQLHKLKGKLLTPYVKARICTCSRERL